MNRNFKDPAQSLEQILRIIERDPSLMKRIRSVVRTPREDRVLKRWERYLRRRGVNTDELLARITSNQSQT